MKKSGQIECWSLSESFPTNSIVEASCIEHGVGGRAWWWVGGEESKPIEATNALLEFKFCGDIASFKANTPLVNRRAELIVLDIVVVSKDL